MKNTIIILLFTFFLISCKEAKENVNLRHSEELIQSEISISEREHKSIVIDTSLLFNVWSTDRKAPSADFLLNKEDFSTVEESFKYSLKNDVIEVKFTDLNLIGTINHLSKDTLKISWNIDSLETTYLTYRNGYEYLRKEILKSVNFYKSNYGKESTNSHFVETELDPKLYELAQMCCDNKDEELLSSFLEMVLATTGSASETTSDILAKIYICSPSLVIEYLSIKYPDNYLKEQLELGFENATYNSKTELINYKNLKVKLEKLLLN